MEEELKQLNDFVRGKEYFENPLNFIKGEKQNKRIYVVFQRFYDLYYIFASANHNLAKASEKNININEFDEIVGENEGSAKAIVDLYIRGEYLKNSILCYNSIEDYIMQILAAEYNLYKSKTDIDDICDKKVFEEQCKKVSYGHISGKINNLQIKNIIDRYRLDSKKIRDYANEMKHRYNFRWKGMTGPDRLTTSEYNCFRPSEVNMDGVIEEMYKLQPKIKKYVEEIYNEIAIIHKLTKIEL
ncbi:hypothetical protein KWY27_13015 [Clostridioides difficile]|nr:hypothetical protein [Clostridioides difficile]MBY2294222.1 hypothetical protein [Clostridioides difficile]HBG5851777.1 hypothetical protein [Clostridioides difficile]